MLVRASNNEIMEVEFDSAPTAVGPSFVEPVPENIDREIAQIVELFWGQTEALAQQNARLNLQQHVQANNQNAALMSVHENAEQGVNRLAEYQRETVAQMERLLQDTRGAMHEQIQALAADQSTRIDKRIQTVLVEAVAARQLALRQAAEAQRIESDMAAAMSRMNAELNQRMTSIEERWKQLQGEIAAKIQGLTDDIVQTRLTDVEKRLQAKAPVAARVQRTIDESISKAESRIEQTMRRALQQHHDEVQATLRQDTSARSPDQDAYIEDRVGQSAVDAERRIEAKMRKTLSEARSEYKAEINRHVEVQQRAHDSLSTRIDKMAARVDALEALPTPPSQRLPSTPSDGKSDAPSVKSSPTAGGLQLGLALAIAEATQEIKHLLAVYESAAKTSTSVSKNGRQQKQSQVRKNQTSLRPVPSARTSSKIAKIVAKVQKDVRERAEAVAKRYDIGKETNLYSVQSPLAEYES